jgi:hypothetical protein
LRAEHARDVIRRLGGHLTVGRFGDALQQQPRVVRASRGFRLLDLCEQEQRAGAGLAARGDRLLQMRARVRAGAGSHQRLGQRHPRPRRGAAAATAAAMRRRTFQLTKN